MILIDTSIWIDHLRVVDADLQDLLDADVVLIHPFVLGELALGHFKNRKRALDNLSVLRQAVVATDIEVRDFIEKHALYGTGVGYVDVHLLTSVRLTFGAQLWTRESGFWRLQRRSTWQDAARIDARGSSTTVGSATLSELRAFACETAGAPAHADPP